MNKKNKNYLNNKRFEELIQLYQSNPGNKLLYEDEIIALFDILISNIINGFKFNVETDDAKQDCFFLILKTLKNFKGEKGTAFNYFTTVIVNNLKLIYSKNKKYRDRVEQYLLDTKRNQTPR